MINPAPQRGLSRRSFLAASGLAGTALVLGTSACTASAGTAASTTAAGGGPVSELLPLRIYGDDAHLVPHRRPLPLDTPRARYAPFPAGTTVLKKGTVRRDGARELPCDIVLERNVALKMRDGVTIYTDVYRPVGDGRHPTLLGWCPYGKDIGGQWLDDLPNRNNVPLSQVSELQRFEGADPAHWVNEGYVVLSPDPRGVGTSEGNITYWGRQLAEDGYDTIEWAAAQPWSTGKVGMTGNSFLAVSQWFIAAEQPPHLAAIAPWEGFSDHFREAHNRGGIPSPSFAESILATISGQNLIEDQPRQIVDEQLLTPYWKDKIARLERIEVPAYVVASWGNGVHTHGTFAGYRQIASKEKWLRVHNSQEWIDYYVPENVAELTRFFDHYLKGVDNGWEKTAKVRLSVLDPGGTDTVNRVESEFPLARTRPTPFHLTAAGGFATTAPTAESELSYEIPTDPAKQAKNLVFTHTFDADTEITGYMSLRLWVEARGSDDMEIAVAVERLEADGKASTSPVPKESIIASGQMRASARELDPTLSTPSEPHQLFERETRLKAGEIVPVDITIWPMGMHYRKGQSLRLTVRPRGNFSFPDDGYGVAALTLPADGGTKVPGSTVPTITLGGSEELPAFVTEQKVTAPASRNAGTHVFHVGGRYDSVLLVPVVPPAA